MKEILLSLSLLFFLSMAGLSHAAQPFGPGETVTYSIKKLGVRVGTATLQYHGPVTIEGRPLLLIVFVADSLNFYDQEQIYVDPKDFRPVIVRRDLDIFGKKEKIVEHYQPDQGRVVITKTARGQTTTTEIKKEGALDNIYGFLYRFRNGNEPALKDSVRLHLPTADVFLKVSKKTKIRAAHRLFEAFYMQSHSKEYRLWFGLDKNRTPIRIDGAIGLGSASLIMTKYQPSTNPGL